MRTRALDIPGCTLDPALHALRQEVREFLADALADRPRSRKAQSWQGVDPDFSRKLGRRGWIGMTIPREYGGAGASALERYVVTEELLAGGAPVRAHWIGDRQTGPMLLQYGTEAQRRRILPGIASGEIFICAGMSEPNAGSDLAAVRTRAERVADGWVINGSKIWTSLAHVCHFMVALIRTDSSQGAKHAGLSQFLIDMKTPGLTVRPIRDMRGHDHLNEVFFENVHVPADALVGGEGDGWKQISHELAYERSGPERYLSSIQLMIEMLDATPPDDDRKTVALGRLVAEAATLRRMSLGVAGMLHRRENPALAASLVKELGGTLEQLVPEVAHDLFYDVPVGADTALAQVMGPTLRAAPSSSIRGGAREILRGIIAKGLETL